MESSIYENMASIEDRHWWFVGRRAILADIIELRVPKAEMEILEVGSGTGGNLAMLSRYGNVTGVEPDEQARALSTAKSVANVVDGRLPGELHFAPESFDLLAAFDVLEHLDDDEGGLRASVACLKPGGKAVLTVPAFPSLWSYHDAQHHHKRRYTKKRFQDLITASGLEVEQISYFNTSLFLPAFLVRLLKRVTGNDRADVEGTPPSVLNAVLATIFASEKFVLRRMNMPFGLSLVAVAHKPES